MARRTHQTAPLPVQGSSMTGCFGCGCRHGGNAEFPDTRAAGAPQENRPGRRSLNWRAFVPMGITEPPCLVALLQKLLLGFTVILLTGCAESESRPPEVKLKTATAIERRATLSILRRTWEDRPTEPNDDHCWYERRLLLRSGFFGRKIRDTETYEEACRFWMNCVRRHLDAYDDETYRGFRGH